QEDLPEPIGCGVLPLGGFHRLAVSAIRRALEMPRHLELSRRSARGEPEGEENHAEGLHALLDYCRAPIVSRPLLSDSCVSGRPLVGTGPCHATVAASSRITLSMSASRRPGGPRRSRMRSGFRSNPLPAGGGWAAYRTHESSSNGRRSCTRARPKRSYGLRARLRGCPPWSRGPS